MACGMSSSLLEPYPQHYKTAFGTQHSALRTRHSEAEWVADDFPRRVRFIRAPENQSRAAKATADLKLPSNAMPASSANSPRFSQAELLQRYFVMQSTK
jgi:hypothetical protein